MKMFLAVCLLMFSPAVIYAMEQRGEFSHFGHPSLPREFYESVYSKILEDAAQKEAVVAFACNRLQTLIQDYREGKLVADRGDLAAVAFGLYHTDSVKQNGAVQGYGKLIAAMSMRAFRKALGITMGMGDVSEYEKWELRKVAPDEFMQIFKAKYCEEDFLRVELIEQIHAHKMLLELAEKQ